MCTPPQIDVELLLRPIPVAPGPGSDADREAVYGAFRRALRGGDVSAQDPRPGGGQGVDLGELIEHGGAYLARGAKDLVIAAWMAEAMTQRSGVAGLRDGLALIRGLLADCWDDCYPPLGRDGDPDLRARPLESLASDRYLLLRLRRSPLPDPQSGAAPFCILDARKGPPGSTTLLTEAEIESGPIGESVRRSPGGFFERLAEDVRQAQEAARALAVAIKERFPDDPPDMDPLRRALAEYDDVLRRIRAIKRRQEPDPDSNGAAADGMPVTEPRGAAPGAATAAVPGPTSAALGFGRVLIAFSERARTLADDAERLKKNREEYGELLNKLRELDAEYEEITARIAGDRDFGPLLAQRLAGPREAPPST